MSIPERQPSTCPVLTEFMTPRSRPAIRPIDTEPRPIPSNDFIGMPPQRASSRESSMIRPEEWDGRHDILHESPLDSACFAVSVQHTQAERNLRPH